MTVYVVVGVYAGCIDHVKAWSDRAKAEKDLAGIRQDYGIRKGQEAESEHAAEMHELTIQ